MKILWFSNCILTNADNAGSGSWLYGMKNVIAGEVELYNITTANVIEVKYNEINGVHEYLLPSWPLIDSLPSSENIRTIRELVDNISPDIIQVWGTENYWAKLCASVKMKGHVLLEMQGIMSSCVDVFYGGLNPNEIKQCRSIKEVIKPQTRLSTIYAQYANKALEENEVLSKFNVISTQSSWVRRQLLFYTSSNCKIYETLIPLREAFYNASKWCDKPSHDDIRLFYSTAYSVPFKGLHIIIKAMKKVVGMYPNARLEIAGLCMDRPLYREEGYNSYLRKLIADLGLERNIAFLGKLSSIQIIERLQLADVFVNSSLVESYSVAVAEALYLGVPSVLAFSGAMPEFSSKKNTTALYYSPLDYVDCANKIIELVKNKELRTELSNNAATYMSEKVSKDNIKKCQLSIYKNVLSQG